MDPLRPFTALIRSLWAARQPRTADPAATSAPPTAGVPSVESRLRLRLRALSPWQAQRAREIFVETVLSSTLGAELETDPEFQPWVHEVSEHLASVQDLSSRLDEMLQSLQRDASGR